MNPPALIADIMGGSVDGDALIAALALALIAMLLSPAGRRARR